MNDQIKSPSLQSLKDRLDSNEVKIADNSQSIESIKGASQEVGQGIPTPSEAKPLSPIKVIPEKTYHVFYNTIQSVKMITTGGRTMAFVLGKYVTDIPEEIDYLNDEIALGNIHLSVKAGEERMTASDLDPMASLRKKHFKEFAEAQAEVARKIAAGESLSQSESEVQQLSPGSTSDIAALAAGSGK